jgi:hypothetical protein
MLHITIIRTAAAALISLVALISTSVQAANSQPDLAGYWSRGGGLVGGGGAVQPGGTVRVLLAQTRGDSSENFETDNSVKSKGNENRPLYRPEYWAQVRALDLQGNDADPTFRCMPAGVPRMGAPQRIVRNADEFIFLYEQEDTFRVVPVTDKHHEERLADETWRGDSIASWQGATLVVDTIGFNDSSWLSTAGFIHSNKLHVVERFTPAGDTMSYQVTVDDPVMYLQPWVMETVKLRRNTSAEATLFEEPPCDERDMQHIVDPLTHH